MNERESKDNPTDTPAPEREVRVVKYNCGCVGFEPDEHGRAILLMTCDGDNSPTPGRFMGQHSLLLNADLADYWQQRIYQAMVKAQGFDNIKNALAPLLKGEQNG